VAFSWILFISYQYGPNFVKNADVDGLMCTNRIELFVGILLTSQDLYIYVFLKDVLHQPVNIILIFKKKIFLQLAKNSYHRLQCAAQTVPE